jgi:hypothetical protein
MKKLLFIIPKVLKNALVTKFAKTILILASLFFLVQRSFAADHVSGCRIGNRIFQIYDTAHPSPTNFQYDSDGNGSPNGYINLDDRCASGNTMVCTLYAHDEVTVMGYGMLADFSIDYCPLDDYVPILFIFTFCVGFLKLLKPKSIKIL